MQTFAPTIMMACPLMVVPGAIVYVVPLRLTDPAVVAVAGLNELTTPQMRAEVSADTDDVFHLAASPRLSAKQSVSIVVFIRMELSP